MKSGLPGAVLLALGSVCCDGARTSGIPVIPLLGSPLVAREIALPRPFSSEPDTMGFAIAVSVAVLGSHLAVLETGNDRIVVFDERREPVGYIGKEGSGPGELRDPVDIAAWRDQYAVTELNNGRISVFDSGGRYLRSFAIPNGYSNLEYGPGGVLYVNAHDGRNYLLAADQDGTLRPFGERPFDLYPDQILLGPAARMSGYLHFVVTDSGTVIVYDPIIAALVSFDSDGRRRGMHLLPGPISDGLIRQSERLAGDFGGLRGTPAPAAITDLSLTSDGRLLLLFPNVGAFGLLVKLPDWTAREIRWGPGMNPRYGGFSGILRGDTLYRLSPDELRLFHLAP